MDLDKTLSWLSRELFSNLSEDSFRVLKILAKNGPLNQKEIGIKTSKFASSFDRWGVKNRLEGTRPTWGLIPNDYVYKINVNKKESKYALTVKGIFASLIQVKFEKIYQVKNYQKFLLANTKNKEIISWIFDFIKFEIMFVMYYNYLQGVDWTKYTMLKEYLSDLHKEFYTSVLAREPKLIREDESPELNFIKESYRMAFYIVYYGIPFVDPKIIYPKASKPDKFTSTELTNIILTNFAKYWYYYIDELSMKSDPKEYVQEFLINLNSESLISQTELVDDIKAKTYAKRFLQQLGYKLKNSL